MSNPTTPFNWQMPTSTDLVTDLPADFEVFGQAVATSMGDLLGGTTGQILSKATNTDMDFVWIANDQGDITGITATSPLTGGGTSGAITVGIQDASTTQKGSVQLSDSTSTTSSVLAATPTAVKSSYDLAAAAIPKSTVTTSGDIIYGTGSGTVTRLGVGSTGQVLTVAAGVPSWATASSGSTNVAGKNTIINSNFSCWQRGTTFSSAANIYTADRWLVYRSGANLTTSRVATSDTTNLPNIQYAARLQRTAASTNLDVVYFMNMFETVNTIPMVGQTVTLSFYARRGANYSATSNILAASVITGTGTDQNWVSGYTGAATPLTTNATLTTTWQRFTVSGTLATSANELTVLFSFTPTGTAGAADLVEITGVQLEIASSASAYSPNSSTQALELAACQRYYYQTNPIGNGYDRLGLARASSTTNMEFPVPLPVAMRIVPTTVTISNLTTTTANTITAVAFNQATTTCGGVDVTTSSVVSGSVYAIMGNNSTSAYIAFSAEL